MAEFILHGISKKIPFPKESYGKLLLDSLRNRNPDTVIMIDAITNETLTNTQFIDLSIRMAIGLQKLGIGKNDVVAIISENCLHYCIPLVACYYIGAIANTINDAYKTSELRNAFNISKPKAVFVSESSLHSMLALKGDMTFVEYIIYFGIGSVDAYNFEEVLNMGEEGAEDFIPVDVDVDHQVSTILCSSGTTGLPKGVMLTHASLRNAMIYMTEPHLLAMTPERSTIGLMPFYHIYGLILTLGTIVSGQKLVIIAKFQPETFLRCIQEYRITNLFIVPSIAGFLAKSPLVDRFDVSSIKEIFCTAAPLGIEIQQILKKRMNVLIRQGYGLTETGGFATVTNPYRKFKFGSSGNLVNNSSAKFIDIDTQKPVGPNCTGEICLKSQRNMKGYMRNEESTKNIFDEDGFVHTGDVGYYDEEGCFFIIERLKELIKYKGFQVPPAEIEDILMSHKSVKDAGVVGVPDERCGELPLAFVVKEPGAEIVEDELKAFVAEHLSIPKQLHGGVRFIEEIPKNSVGKMLRSKLKELI